MITDLYRFLYGSTPAEFKSAFDLSESVTHLQAATKRTVFGVLAEQAAVGPVSESRVRLQRVIPMVGNSFKPFFHGRFEFRNGSVYLVGRFTMLTMAKIFFTFWLSLAFAGGVAMAFAQRGHGVVAFAGFGLFGGGLLLIAVGKWFARNDIAWLSDSIGKALGPAAPGPATLAQKESSGSRPTPTALRVAALCFLVMGCMSAWSALMGTANLPADSGHSVVSRVAQSLVRPVSAALGLTLLGLSIGVYRRKQWAWRAGLVLIGMAGLTTIYQALLSGQFPNNATFRAFYCAASLAVSAYWARWWYAQRVHFLRDVRP